MTRRENLARYRRLAARANAVATIGWFRAANDRYERDSATLEGLLAKLPAHPEEGLSLAKARLEGRCQAAFARIDRAEHLYWRRCIAPLEEAIAVLVRTPAPDLEALREKIGLIRAHRLHEADCMSRDCCEVLEKDVDALLRKEMPRQMLS